MKAIDRHTWELLRHTLRNFLVVFVMLILAVALDFLEHSSAKFGVSPWLVFGIELMAKAAFLFDALLFITTTGMVSAHFVREYYRNLFGK
jgi:hypothetical protein